ncbi:hypothetical protein N7445_009261 [Penicillium cf. griseofulvum]|nr:hypothetical protein N7445_009261 [Penicillium cf. griseofulvum]
MPPRNPSSKVWDQWRRLVVNRDTPKKLKYTTSDLSPLNIKLVSTKDIGHASWFEPWDGLDKLTLTEPESLNKLPTLDLEADQKLDVPSRQDRHYSVCYELCEEDEFYKIDNIRAPGYPFTRGWYPLSLDEFCVRDRECQETPHPHLQMAIFSFDCPDDSSILASELSALVQIIGIRSRQSTFSGTHSIAALLISIFGARQVRVIQAFYSKGKCKKGGKEGEPELTVKLGKTMDLASENENENEERMDEIIRWMACSLSFLQTEKT